MTNRRSSVLPAIVSGAVGLTGTIFLFALPGDAAPDPGTFSAVATGEVLRVKRLDLDMSGNPVRLDVGVAGVVGKAGKAAAPDRSRAEARNVAASPAPSGGSSAVSVATSNQDTAGSTSSSGAAGSLQGVRFGGSALSSRGRWAGDTACLPADVPMTTSRVALQGSGTVPAAIPAGTATLPIPVPTGLPTEFPTAPSTSFPTALPTDLPTALPSTPTATTTPLPTGTALPTVTSAPLPTGTTAPLPNPTTLLPEPTSLPTTSLPSASLPTAGLPSTTVMPDQSTGDADGVSMVALAAMQVAERTQLEKGGAGGRKARRVVAEVTGTLAQPNAPALTFFGGEAALRMIGEPKLTAYSTGGRHGSQVEWTAPKLELLVGDETYTVPTDGSALALPYSKNADVVLTIARGDVHTAEHVDGVLAQAEATVLDILIKHGDTVALEAELFPMAVTALSPVGGVDCKPLDTDGDGLPDFRELKLRTDPERKDTDRDRLSDGKEVKKFKTNPRRKDTDRDRLNDRQEIKKYKTNPKKKDTDGDGVPDGREVRRGTDPTDRRDR